MSQLQSFIRASPRAGTGENEEVAWWRHYQQGSCRSLCSPDSKAVAKAPPKRRQERQLSRQSHDKVSSTTRSVFAVFLSETHISIMLHHYLATRPSLRPFQICSNLYQRFFSVCLSQKRTDGYLCDAKTNKLYKARTLQGRRALAIQLQIQAKERRRKRFNSTTLPSSATTTALPPNLEDLSPSPFPAPSHTPSPSVSIRRKSSRLD